MLQVDNLKTNRKGTFVLTDTSFAWIRHLSGPVGTSTPEAAAAVLPYTQFPAGLVAGALHRLGRPCTVQAEVTEPPVCAFTIQMEGEPR